MKNFIATLALVCITPLANSAILTLTLNSVDYTEPAGGSPSADISATTASYSFDTITQQFSSSGLTSIQYNAGPDTLMKHEMNDFSIHYETGIASASSFNCTEGTFGAFIGSNICDSYTIGDNKIDEGGSGDDGSLPAHDLTIYNMQSWAWDSLSLTLSSTLPFDPSGPDGVVDIVMNFSANFAECVDYYHYENGELLFTDCAIGGRIPADQTGFYSPSAVPVPAAAWLFGSALVGLAGIKRRT